jgi:uncharacterized damage-inducible protein DinB
MTTAYIQSLYKYNAWANQVITDTSAQLSEIQFSQPAGASFDSIHDTLVHTMSAQWVWLSRWQGTSPTALFDPASLPSLAAIRERWAMIERDTQTFIATLDDATLNQNLTYQNTQGKPFSFPLWQQMIHQVNHATQHRSEIAMILTQFGFSPGEIDLIRYLQQHEPA